MQFFEEILADACDSVADDIEAGVLVTGRARYFTDDGCPNCALGHVFARAGYFPTDEEAPSTWFPQWHAIASYNDCNFRGRTATALRSAAADLRDMVQP